MSKFWIRCVLLLLVAPCVANATPVSQFLQQVSDVFTPAHYLGLLDSICSDMMLIFQSVSVVFIVASLCMKFHKHDIGNGLMEEVATTLLMVAFIAIIPNLRDTALRAGDSLADATGYRPVNFNGGAPSPLMGRIFDLANQWLPQGSASSDQLNDQAHQAQPQADDTRSWWERAADLAGGIYRVATGALDYVATGILAGLRIVVLLILELVVGMILLICGILYYPAEFLRNFLMYVGCIFLPIFIAGLGLEFFKGQAQKYILGLVAIAAWPIGWAVGSIGTVLFVDLFNGLISMFLVAAGVTIAGAAAGAVPLAAATPVLAWSAVACLIICAVLLLIWNLAVLLLAPVLMSKMLTSGAQFAGGLAGAAFAGSAAAGAAAAGAAATVLTGGAAAPVVAGGGAAAAGGGAAGAGVGGVGAGAAGAAGAGAGSGAGAGAAGSAGAASSNSPQAMAEAVKSRLASVLRGAAKIMDVASHYNPDREHESGRMIGGASGKGAGSAFGQATSAGVGQVAKLSSMVPWKRS